MKDNPNHIRTIAFDNLKIGGESSFPIFEPILVLNIPISAIDTIKEAQRCSCDILGLKFNIDTVEQIPQAVNLLKKLLPEITKPLMIQGSGNNDIDKVLLPELTKTLNKPAIIASANENTYKEIIPEIIKGSHIAVLKSPIDINLAKELNILSKDLGLDLDKILIDSDIGGLGYGFEYGYSIMEKIKLEGLKGDNYLNMPLISFAPEESLKTKEAKSDTFDKNWGELKTRAINFELAAASAAMAAGANVIVMNYPSNIEIMKGLK